MTRSTPRCTFRRRERFEAAGFEVVGVYGDRTGDLTRKSGRITVVGAV